MPSRDPLALTPPSGDLPATVRRILRGLKRCQPELRPAAWLFLDGQGQWIDERRIEVRSRPPRAIPGMKLLPIPHLPGSFVRICGPVGVMADLVKTAMDQLDLAAEQHVQRKVREQLSVVWETAVDAIITIDERGAILSCNPATERLFGWSISELVGQNISVIMPRPYREEHDSYLNHYMKTGKRKIIGVGRRVPGQRKDGHIFPAHLSVSEFYLAGNRYFTGILRDISDVVEARTRAAVEERKHISRELHDSVSQALFGIVLGSQAAVNALNSDDKSQLAVVKESLYYIMSLAESGLSEMRALMFELRPESLEAEGLLVSLRRQAEALAKRYQIQAEFCFPEQEPQVSLTIKHEVYRFVMEALHNVVKHARANTFSIRLDGAYGTLQAEVADNGVGFIPEEVPAGHVGIQSMRERVASLGGRLRIESKPGEGTRLQAVLMQGDGLQ